MMDWDRNLAAVVARTERCTPPVVEERDAPGLPSSGDPHRDYPELADLHGGASNVGDDPSKYGGIPYGYGCP